MIKRHRMPGADFAALAKGGGDAAAVALLRDSRLSRTLIRLDALRQTVPEPELAAGFDLLAKAQQKAPEAVRETLCHPQVSAWSAHALRLACTPGNRGADLQHLACIAAVAAARAGLTAEIDVPVRRGRVILPGLGGALVGPAHGHTAHGEVSDSVAQSPEVTARFRTAAGRMEVRTAATVITIPADPASDGRGWQGLRRIRTSAAGRVLDVSLDDLDPFRDLHALGATDRLGPSEAARWTSLIADAWDLLASDHPGFADGMAGGLTSFVPLAPGSDGRGMSATSADAFGACMLTRPADAVALAATLVHEFQHTKLGAVHDLFPLHTAPRDELYYSPWRDDPRPLWGLMHGAYAYLGVTDFWATQRRLRPAHSFAHFEFARWRAQTQRALRTIGESGRLTVHGARFVAGMQARAETWNDAPVPDEPAELARSAVADHEAVWLLRNQRPDPVAVDSLARDWVAGGTAPFAPVATTVVASGRALENNSRLDLIYLRLRDPDEFQNKEAPAADRAYCSGDLAAAARGYRARLAETPGDPHAWAGLTLVRRDGPIEKRLSRPDLLAAVHRRVAELSGASADPDELAAWLRRIPRSHHTAGG
jgi:HEXXH motif-containing protein